MSLFSVVNDPKTTLVSLNEGLTFFWNISIKKFQKQKKTYLCYKKAQFIVTTFSIVNNQQIIY